LLVVSTGAKRSFRSSEVYSPSTREEVTANFDFVVEYLPEDLTACHSIVASRFPCAQDGPGAVDAGDDRLATQRDPVAEAPA